MNPPDDTWVAFAGDKRGYKKHCHFKVAVSRGAVRFLFEAGPELADKKRWIAAWKRDAPKLVPVLRRAKGLAWFKNEHDETPTAVLSTWRRTRWPGSATSYCARATARSSWAARCRPPRRRAGRPPTTRAPRARR